MTRVLVIEDNRANLELMTYLLGAYKYETVSAEDGEAGLAVIRSAEPPDVVVCDIQLPRMDGYEIVRRAKADAATRSIPIIAVTAFAMVGDRDRALAAGFDGYIGKPIVPETFVSQVEQFVTRKSGASPATHESVVAAKQPERSRHVGARVLVVDNTPENRDYLAHTLSAFGYEVVAASNAATGLSNARTVQPDLIISDMHMPGIDGCEFLARVREEPALREVPFMIASASGVTCDCKSAVGECADLYLPMPAEPAELLLHVEKLLDEKGASHGDHPRR
jgi:two-component system, cell cycle response regulator